MMPGVAPTGRGEPNAAGQGSRKGAATGATGATGGVRSAHSYASTSRTASRVARNAGRKLATSDRIATITNQ